MFQYAIARSIAYTNQTDFKLDISGFESLKPPYTPREYELGNFNISEHFATTDEIQRYNKKKSLVTTVFEKIFPPGYHYYYEKKKFNYDPEVFKLKGDIYLEGYWQTEKYFENIENVILNDFTVKTEPAEKNKALLDKIKNCNAVAVHIRRGDYVTNPQTESFHGSCDLSYYRKCVALIVKRVSDPHFFVFSDDPKWAKENLQIDFPATFSSHNGPDRGYEDLRLMRHCKHFIIANSSFSWWGAWLSRNSDKIVVAPKRWMRKEDIVTKDLIPDGWLSI